MNATEAKKIPLPQLMAKLGYEPTEVKKGGNEYWYRSPFRNEKESSFHTSYLGGKWIWNDFGDRGGTVIDFVMRHEGLNRVVEALQYLEGIYPASSSGRLSRVEKTTTEPTLFSFQQQEPKALENFSEKELEFREAHPIHNPVIHAYLEGRGIAPSLANQHLQEVKYRNVKTGKCFFAFGMRNESGGYEIRAATDAYPFKSALIKRDITLIKGQQSEPYSVNLFEGMIDFLSLLVMLNVSHLSGDSIVMHSLSSFQRTVTAIENTGYMKVNLFLDNNKAGQGVNQKFKDELGEKAFSQSFLFEPHEDLNDALVANHIPDWLAE